MLLDSKSVVENIYVLAKLRGMKIGALESAVGIKTAGYFSRFLNDESESRSLPSVEILSKVAEKLGVTIDQLVTIDFKKFDDVEISLVTFLGKLTESTANNSLIWSADTFRTMANTPTYCFMKDFPLRHVVTKQSYVPEYDTYQPYDETVFWSLFLDQEVDLLGDILRLEHNGKTFLLVRVQVDDEPDDTFHNQFPNSGPIYYEMYTVISAQMKKLANACVFQGQNNPVLKAFEKLYQAASKSAQYNPTGEDIIKVIKDYMKHFGFED